MTAITADNRLAPDDAAKVVTRIVTRKRTDEATELDLRPLDQVVAKANLDLDGVGILANALLAVDRQRPLLVRLPGQDTTLEQLARGGLLFALAQRAHTTVEFDQAEGTLFPASEQFARLGEWRNRWDPSDGEFRARVFGLAASSHHYSGVSTVQPRFVAFVNPHKSVGRDRLVKDLNERVARFWLERIVAEAPHFVSATTEIITELLFNLQAHPFVSLATRPVLKRDVPLERRFALLSLFTTSDRLHIIVFDTGHGIAATLRPKFKRSVQGALGDDRELLERMLRNDLPPYGRGEGRGFSRLVDLARRFDGNVHVTTSADLDYSGTLIGDVHGDTVRCATLTGGDFAGTAVHVTLRLDGQVLASLADPSGASS